MGFPNFLHRTLSGTLAVAPAALFLAVLLTGPSGAFAQPASDDPYGVGPSISVPDTAKAPDPAKPAAVDTAVTIVPAPAPAPKAPRPRVTRETTVNPMDVHRGTYRNPKKALFLSLIVPGLGQAYIGQSTFNYVRAAAYFTAEVTMGVLWYEYSVVKYDRKVKQYRSFADQHWSQASYESKITEVIGGGGSSQSPFDLLNPGRTSYCSAVQSQGTTTGANNYAGCIEPYSDNATTQNNYSSFRNTALADDPSTPTGLAAIKARREAFPDPVAFYEMIGGNQEFLFGWSDVSADPSLSAGGTNPGYEVLSDTAASWIGVSAYRDRYNAMRGTAKEYSRMQTWFLGGIVLNHIASAVDAALTARRHNRILYEDGGTGWIDRLHLDGGMAFEGGRPLTHMTAYLSF
jgi:hypothetical protein